MAEALAAALLVLVIFALRGTVWETKEEREQELRELRRSIGRDADKGV